MGRGKQKQNKMKKILLLLAVVGLTVAANATETVYSIRNENSICNNAPQDTVKRYISVSLRNHRTHDSYGMTFSKDGSFSYSYYGQNGASRTDKGTYYLDSSNNIHLSWDNGMTEVCELSYYGDGLCRITNCSKFRGYIYQYD